MQVGHRGLVDDQQVARQRLGRPAPEPEAAARQRVGLQQAVDRAGRVAGDLLQPPGGAPRRRAQRDLLLGVQRGVDDRAHRVGLAGPGAAVQEREPLGHRQQHRLLLLVGELALADASALGGARGRPQPRDVGGDRDLGRVVGGQVPGRRLAVLAHELVTRRAQRGGEVALVDAEEPLGRAAQLVLGRPGVAAARQVLAQGGDDTGPQPDGVAAVDAGLAGQRLGVAPADARAPRGSGRGRWWPSGSASSPKRRSTACATVGGRPTPPSSVTSSARSPVRRQPSTTTSASLPENPGTAASRSGCSSATVPSSRPNASTSRCAFAVPTPGKRADERNATSASSDRGRAASYHSALNVGPCRGCCDHSPTSRTACPGTSAASCPVARASSTSPGVERHHSPPAALVGPQEVHDLADELLFHPAIVAHPHDPPVTPCGHPRRGGVARLRGWGVGLAGLTELAPRPAGRCRSTPSRVVITSRIAASSLAAGTAPRMKTTPSATLTSSSPRVRGAGVGGEAGADAVGQAADAGVDLVDEGDGGGGALGGARGGLVDQLLGTGHVGVGIDRAGATP